MRLPAKTRSHLTQPKQLKPVWVTLNQAVVLSKIGRRRIYKLLAEGALKSIKRDRKRLILFESIERLGQ
jgi:hypothetical protein